MIEFNVLIQYTLTAISGIVALALIVIQGREKLKTKEACRNVLFFVLNTTAISMIMFIMYGFEVMLDHYSVAAVFRVLDYSVYALLLFSWMSLLQALYKDANADANRRLILFGKLFALAGMLVFAFIAVFFMNETYHIVDDAGGNFYHVSEVVFSVVGSLLIALAAFRPSGCMPQLLKRYIMLTSVFLILYLLVQIPLASDIGIAEIASWMDYSSFMDISGWALLAINIAACWFIYVKDFQGPYTVAGGTGGMEGDLAAAITEVAGAYKLTHRESEIAGLVYEGKSNAEISEALYISISTVKTHMRNIFAKTDVSSRLELMHIINSKMLRKK